jgi:ribokinase
MSVVVFGSANVDLMVDVERHPHPGETVASVGPIRQQAGGKGLNQAIAARRAGGCATTFIGAVGSDDAAAILEGALRDGGVDMRLRRSAGPSGSAIILLDPTAENEIVVVAGANADLVDVTTEEELVLRRSQVAIFQGETPTPGFVQAAAIVRNAGGLVILNPSPVWNISPSELALVDVLVVNEAEAILLAGVAPDREGDLTHIWRSLRARVPAVVITLGGSGVLWGGEHDPAPRRLAALRVQVRDTTGAGDTFCGVLAASLAQDHSLGEAVRRGAIAASIAVTRRGAAAAIPARSELDFESPSH